MAVLTTNVAWTIPSTASKVFDLTKQSRNIPTPGPNQVLVKLTAVSLNFRDVLISTRSPYYPGDHKVDLVPGSDGAGTIHSTGATSTWAKKEGTKVLLHCNNWITGDAQNLALETVFGGNGTDGTLQQWLVVGDELVVEAPSNLSAVESAAMVTAGTTAWAAIRGGMDLRLDGVMGEWPTSWTEKRLTGKTVLTMGTGGVSCFAIQIASALGATVISTSSSQCKLDFAISLGATHVINYAENPDWDQEVLKLTNGKGVDIAVETGGAGTLMKSLTATRTGGLISLLGILTPAAPIPYEIIPSVLFGQKIIRGHAGFSRNALAEFAHFAQANNIKPVIAQVFTFEQTIEAFEALQKQNAVGKIVVNIAEQYEGARYF